MHDATASSGRIAKVLKYGGLSMATAIVVVLAAHIVWTRSGSNEWQVVSDENGIRISTLKTPGDSSLKYKVSMQVKSRLSDVVSFLSDTHTGNDLGAFDIERIEEVSAPPVFYAYDSYKLGMPAPFGEIEVMIINQYYQDPLTKQVSVNVHAAPNKRPLDNNVRRVVQLSNNWTLTPLENGSVDMESISQMDLGMPYVLANLAMPKVIDGQFDKIREILQRDSYKNKRPAFISELHEEQQADAR
jgi:hypothetical protein